MGILENSMQRKEMERQQAFAREQQEEGLRQEQIKVQTAISQQQSGKIPASQEFYSERISFVEVIMDFKHWLMGYSPSFDKEGNKCYEFTHDQKLNLKGCNDVTSIVSSFLNKSIILGYLDEEQILVKMNYFMKEFAHLVCLNFHIWELDKTKKSMLVNEVVTLVHLTMTRALGGTEADQLSTAISRVENVQQNNRPQSGGGNGKFFGLLER